jgi:hypothetical protein
MKVARGTALLVGLAFSAIAGAVDFDGSVPLKCLGVKGFDCDPTKGCDKLKPETKITPEVTIDLGGKTIKTPYRTTLLPIQNSVLNDEQLELQGTDLKFAWSAIVNRKTGKVTITIADRVGAYVIFGQCKVAEGT